MTIVPKLYVVVSNLSSQGTFGTMEHKLARYRSKLAIGNGTWLIATSGTARELHEELMIDLPADEAVLVVRLRADLAWSRKSPLQDWLPRQLAALS